MVLSLLWDLRHKTHTHYFVMQWLFFSPQLIYCNICCEPYHEFCVEVEEEIPDASHLDDWVCSRCQFCHVCGRINNVSFVLLFYGKSLAVMVTSVMSRTTSFVWIRSIPMLHIPMTGSVSVSSAISVEEARM